MNDNIAISIQNLTKIYHLYDKPQDRLKEALNPFKKSYHHDFYAMNDVSFEIKKGETVGIVGKNGAGKSTLLKMITGVLTPTSGSIEVNGKIASLLELGAGFNPEMTGYENIYLNGTLMGFSKEEIDTKVDAILEFADIGEFIQQPVKIYSSGMFARLAFSIAINVEPDILIVDEVLAVGDLEFQKKCLGKINEVSKRGRTVIFVSHNLAAIKNLCPKVIFLDRGKIIKFSNVNVAIRDYLALDKNESDNNFNDTKKGHVALNQILTIKNIYYLNNKREHVEYIVSGEKMYFDILFNIDQKLKSLDDVLFEIRIKDGIKEKLFTLSTYLTNSNYNNLMNDSSVLCEVNNFSIAPGEYHIDIICSVGKDYSDYLIDCKKINVVDGNYHNSGKKYENILYGPLLIEHNWLKE